MKDGNETKLIKTEISNNNLLISICSAGYLKKYFRFKIKFLKQ